MRSLASFLLGVGLVAGAASAAPTVGYATATGYYKRESRPTLHQPLNLLDGREITSWCSPTGDALSEHLTFGFKGVARVDEVRIYTGNGFNDRTWDQYSRVRKVSIKGPSGALTVNVADQRGLQAVSLDPPIVGERLSIEILDIYPAEDLDYPACITDVVFYSDGKPLNGPWLTQKLKYDRHRATLLGTWFSGHEGAPDRFLSFFFDGTYRFVYDPYDPALKGRAFGGSYSVNGSRLTLENVPGKGRANARLRRERTRKKGRGLVLTGDLPEELKQPFRDSL